MALVEDFSQTDVLTGVGLPRDGVAAWLANNDTLGGDYGRDSEDFSRQWRVGAELLAKLPAKSARSQSQAVAAAAILQRDRAAREKFLRLYAAKIYRHLTADLTKFVRVEHLVRAAAATVPGLVPDDAQLAGENGLSQRDKDGAEIDQGLFLSHVLADAACGMHLCHAMLLPRPEAEEQSRRFAKTGKLTLDGAIIERRGNAALVTMRNPRFLNAEDETTLDGLEIAERTHVVALGISTDGVKIPLGLWEGSTENATLARTLLADLVDRGLDPEQAILFVIDGGKALRKAINDVFDVDELEASTSSPTGSPTRANLRVETPTSIRSITARVNGSRSAKYP